VKSTPSVMAATRVAALAILLGVLVGTPALAATPQCTVTALGAGKDDGPALVSAMQTCSQVIVPSTTKLNISSAMNMTGLNNAHLVSS
jgi:galacturan 1,4-alpha-galacturonidase